MLAPPSLPIMWSCMTYQSFQTVPCHAIHHCRHHHDLCYPPPPPPLALAHRCCSCSTDETTMRLSAPMPCQPPPRAPQPSASPLPAGHRGSPTARRAAGSDSAPLLAALWRQCWGAGSPSLGLPAADLCGAVWTRNGGVCHRSCAPAALKCRSGEGGLAATRARWRVLRALPAGKTAACRSPWLLLPFADLCAAAATATTRACGHSGRGTGACWRQQQRR